MDGEGLHLGDGAVMGNKYDIYHLRFTSAADASFSFIPSFVLVGRFSLSYSFFSLNDLIWISVFLLQLVLL